MDVYRNGFTTEALAREQADNLRIDLKYGGKPAHQGPWKTTLGEALADYGLEHLPHLKGAVQDAVRINRFLRLVSLLRQAAEADNVEAQEMLGIALLVGPTLYGRTVKIDRCEAGNWMRRAAAQGSEVGKHQLTFLNRLPQAPSGKDVC